MDPILEFRDIVKIYEDGVIANRGVSFSVQERTIHAIVGENGAGKTTLMNVLFGITDAQGGEILLRGRPVSARSPTEAIRLGIGMVHQHLMLAPDLTVAENIVLGTEPRRGRIFLDTGRAAAITAEISRAFGLEVPAGRKIRELPIGLRQRVEILKALYRNAEILILDEPTSVLTPQETEILFATLRSLKEQGKTILFISHKLREVKRIADRITVMRDGRVIATREPGGLSEHDIAYLMVGREISFEHLPPSPAVGETVLEVRGLSYTDERSIRILKGVSFEVRAGEIVGLAGVVGNGQTELVRILAGLLAPTGGEVRLKGGRIDGLSPRRIRERALAHIPEDRMEDGVAEKTSVEENLIVDRYYRPGFSRGGRLDWRAIGRAARDLIRRFSIVARSPRTPVSSLSGGNVQKVVLARELSSDPDLVIAAQPTRGVDVGSEEMVHSLLREARDRGKAIFLVSADLDEILKLSSRILVIYGGQIVARFSEAAGLNGRDLGPYMLGVRRQEATAGG
jgi:simple sugar transport system ATP-binding protein